MRIHCRRRHLHSPSELVCRPPLPAIRMVSRSSIHVVYNSRPRLHPLSSWTPWLTRRLGMTTDMDSIDGDPWPVIVDKFERSTAPCGWDSTPLPVIAVRCNEVKVLVALHSARILEPEYYSDPKYSFDKTLLVCVRWNKKELFRWLLERGVTSNKPFKLIKEIVDHVQWPILNALFEHQQKIFVGYTKTLEGVVLTKNAELVRFLLENHVGKWLSKATIVAIQPDQQEILDLLLTHQEVVEIPLAAIEKAAKKGNVEMVRLLHTHGASDHDIAFKAATKYGHADVVRYLLRQSEQSVSVEMLHIALKNGYHELVEGILDEQTDRNTRTLLRDAVEKEYGDVLHTILQRMDERIDETRALAKQKKSRVICENLDAFIRKLKEPLSKRHRVQHS